ncbi:hypothetical protein FI667_g7673, partial [Globisporangium splendens]
MERGRRAHAKWRAMPLHVHKDEEGDTNEEQQKQEQDEEDSLSDSEEMECETQNDDSQQGATTRRGTRYGAQYAPSAKQLRHMRAAPRKAAKGAGQAVKNGAHAEDDKESPTERENGDCGVKTKRRKRKATYHDEIEQLQERMEELEHELKALKFHALMGNGTSNGRNGASATPLRKGKLTGHFLHDAIQSQQVALAGLQAMLSSYTSLQERSPFHVCIYLSKDPKERRDVLAAARTKALEQTKRFVRERHHGMDMLKLYAEQERFETARGDYCVMGFDIIPLSAAKSVKSVFDNLLFLINNVEITFTDMMGHITIRENDDDSSCSEAAQFRVVSTLTDGVYLEANAVRFTEFQPARSKNEGDDDDEGGESEFGIILVDYVDDDELYPLQPDTRILRETSCVFTVQACPKHQEEQVSGGIAVGDANENEKVVVVTRWSLTKLHKSEIVQDFRVMQAMRASIGAWGDKMLQWIYETIQNTGETPFVCSTAVAINK